MERDKKCSDICNPLACLKLTPSWNKFEKKNKKQLDAKKAHKVNERLAVKIIAI